jgi:hypothetical protein
MIQYTEEQIAKLDKYYKHPRNLVDLFENSVAKWTKGTPEEIMQNKNVQEFLIEAITKRLKKSYGGYEIPQKFFYSR